jgi:choice-of-anchor B domain-containing protein
MLHKLYFTLGFIITGLVALAQTPCINGLSGIYPCQGYDLCSFTPLEELGGGVKGNDCWGWVDEVSGREFFIFGRTNGTCFVEITDPYSPVYLAELPPVIESSIWRDMKVVDDYAYIVTESDGGIQIVELTQLLDLSGPTIEITPALVYDTLSHAHNIAINTESKYAYTMGDELKIIDVSVPAIPVFVASYEEFGSHDLHTVIYHGPDEDYQGKEILFNFAYDSFDILNADDKTDVQLLSSLSDTTLSIIHQGWTDEDHRFVYFNDEGDEINLGLNTRTFIVDIEDLDNPVIMGFYEHETLSTDHNLYVQNGKVYAANNSSGLRVLTIEDDGSLEMFGYFDTYPEDDAAGYTGVWSNYPYFPSKNIALSNRDGLFVIRESASSTGYVEAVDNYLSLSPNPSTSTVMLSGEFHNCEVLIYDMAGRIMLSTPSLPSINGLHIDITSLKEGMYVVNLKHSVGKVVSVSKLIVTQIRE